MIRDFTLWMADTFIGTLPATPLVELVFLVTGVFAPLILIGVLFMLARLVGSLNPYLFMLTGVVGIFLALVIALTPLVHAQRFVDCERKAAEYRGTTVTELWCADRGDLTQPFGESTFRRIVD